MRVEALGQKAFGMKTLFLLFFAIGIEVSHIKTFINAFAFSQREAFGIYS